MKPFLSWPKHLAAGLIRLYQVALSPILGDRCRFYPSCSEYTRQSILKHGFVKGSLYGIRRILRCHPWNPGGYDPVK